MTPVFEIFNPIGFLFYDSSRSHSHTFCIKIDLSLLHLVQEILGHKVGLICHQNVLFNRC